MQEGETGGFLCVCEHRLVTLAEIGLRFDAVKGVARHDTLFTEPGALV